MFSGKTKRKIPHSSGRCLAPPPDWLDITQVSNPAATEVNLQRPADLAAVSDGGQSIATERLFHQSQTDACERERTFKPFKTLNTVLPSADFVTALSCDFGFVDTLKKKAQQA